MHGYNFTERVRAAIAMAREEAARLDHEFIGTEHIVLGLIREEGAASAVLQNLGIDVGAVARKIEATVKPGRAAQPVGPDLPYTSRSKKVLEYAMDEAHELGLGFVGTQHLLLGVLREEKGMGAQVLFDAGARIEAVRAETVRLHREAHPAAAHSASARQVVAVAVEVRYDDGSTRRDEFPSALDAIGFLARPQ